MAAISLVLTWLAPLALAAALLPVRGRRLAIAAAPLAAIPALVAVWSAPPLATVTLPPLVFGLELGLPGETRTLLLLAGLLWGLSASFARPYMAGDPHGPAFFAFLLLAMAGNLGLIVAMGEAAFLTFYALMSFSAYGLVLHHRDAEAARAGRYYIALAVASEVLVFTGLVAGSDLIAGSGLASGWIAALLLVGFGVKVGVLGLHVWLPLAHPSAPVPASAVLSGVMIKAGLVGWLRFLPLDAPLAAGWGIAVAVAGLAAAFAGVLLGLPQRAPKVILAYSSVSQMGVMTAIVGFALLSPRALPLALGAIGLYALHHGLAKGALFLGVGVWHRAGRRWVLAVMGWLGLVLAGAPLTSGALAKKAIDPVVRELPAPWPGWLFVLLPLSALATTLLMARLLARLVAESPPAAARWPAGTSPWIALVAASAVVPWLVAEKPALGASALWPVAAGAALAGLAARWRPRWLTALSGRIPPGDLIAVWEAIRAGRFAAGRGGAP